MSNHRIFLTLISDWHVGSGTGQSGNIDRLVRRDKDGFPFIPAKTLTGIWRDACERVALGLDENQPDGVWQKWVLYIFGDQPALEKKAKEDPPKPAALEVRSAQLPLTLREAIGNRKLLQQAITFIKPGIAIDPNTGCTRPDYLRYEEMVRGGAELEATYTLKGLSPGSLEYQTAQALLAAGAAMVERLGAKRRRGAGRCEMALDYPLADAIAWLKTHSPVKVPAVTSDTSNLPATPTSGSGSWYYVQLNLEALSPISIHNRTVGNVVETLDYIPGTCLLAIIYRQLQQLGVETKQAIARGDLLVTHATLQVEGKKGRPVPFALFKEKLGNKIYNRFCESQPQENQRQLKGYRQGFVGQNSATLLPPREVTLAVETHNTIEDKAQRPNEEVGGVYSYEAIEEGTHFVAEVRLKEGLYNILNSKNIQWWQGFNCTESIGRSKKDDYGLVSITANEPQLFIDPTITEKELTVWLLSDVLLRDKRLRPTTDLDEFRIALQEKLGVELQERKPPTDQMSMLARSHRIESWQTRWNLPRPTLVGLSAGTCIVYEVVSGELDATKIANLQGGGIGERRAEGYGQLCLNDSLLGESLSHKTFPEPEKNSSKSSTLSPIQKQDKAFCYARIIERAAWRETIRRRVLELAANEDGRKKTLGIEIDKTTQPFISKPPMSQLGTLRSLFERLRQPEDAVVIAWFDAISEVSNRRDKWPSGSLDKIRHLVSNEEQVWQHLKLNISELVLTQTGESELKQELWTEALLTLVDTCIRAHRRELEVASSNGK